MYVLQLSRITLSNVPISDLPENDFWGLPDTYLYKLLIFTCSKILVLFSVIVREDML